MTDNESIRGRDEVLSDVFRSPDRAPMDAVATYKVHKGATRVTVTDSGIVHQDLSRRSSRDIAELPAPSESILATAKTPWGERCAPSQINKDTRVWIDGFETTVGNAEFQGYLHMNPNTGIWQESYGYGDPHKRAQLGTLEQPKRADVPLQEPVRGEPLDPMSEALLGEAYTKAQGETFGVIHDIVFRGEASQEKVGHLAERLGIAPNEALRQVQHVYGAFVGEAERSIASIVHDPAAALAWAHANKPDAFKDAMMGHVDTGIPDYAKFAREYLENLDTIDPESILQASSSTSMKARRVGSKIIVSDPVHGEVEWKAGVRMGLIKVS